MLNKISSIIPWAFAFLLAFAFIPSTIAVGCAESGGVEVDPAELLADQITPWLERWNDNPSPLSIQISCQIEIDRKPQSIEIQFVRATADRYVLACKHPDYEAILWRTEDRTALVLPKHRKVFFTEGETDSMHHLRSTQFLDRWLSEGTWLYAAKNLLHSTEAADCGIL